MKSMAERAKRVKPAELAAVAAEVVLPEGATDIMMVVEQTPGLKIPGMDYPSGVGGRTQYGPAWMIEGRVPSKPIALYDSPLDARDLYNLIAGPEGELWQRRERRRRLIAEAQAAETALAEEAKATAKSLKVLARKGVDVAEATGGGSSRRKRSSVKRMLTTGTPSVVGMTA